MHYFTPMMMIIACLCGPGQLAAGAVDIDATASDETLPVDPTGRLTTETLGNVSDVRIRSYLRLYRDAYSLTDEQADKFKQQLLRLKEEQIRYTLMTLEERNRLHAEGLAELRGLKRDEQPSNKFHQIRGAMQSLNAGNPLFDEINVERELEKLLPQQQVEQGRLRLEQIRKRSHDRNTVIHLCSVMQRDGTRRLIDPRKDGWEAYVKQFCVRFQLTDAQTSSAQSSLRDAIELRDEFMRTHQREWDEILSCQRLPSDPVLDELEAIWQRLLSHLDQIPTAEQVARVHAASLRPNLLVTATRPTDYTEGIKGRRADAPATQPHPASANDDQTIIEPTMDADAAASASQPAP